MKVIAIDFETANHSRSSACALGIAEKTDNDFCSEQYLIRPVPCEFDSKNINIHGITSDDVSDAPTFAELLPQLVPKLNNSLVLVHNANFDVDVFCCSLGQQSLPCFQFYYYCTYSLLKNILPNLQDKNGKQCYRLNFLAKVFDIELEHHNAASDALATLKIFYKILDLFNIPTAEQFFQTFDLRTGIVKCNNQQCYNVTGDDYDINDSLVDDASRTRLYKKAKKISIQDKTQHYHLDWDKIRKTPAVYPLPNFENKRFVLSGDFNSTTRQDILEKIKLFGGIPLANVSGKTDYLIIGSINSCKPQSKKSNKILKAEALQSAGGNIKIISEYDFWVLIHDNHTELQEAIQKSWIGRASI